jgi:excisionase family DNA binding protein
LQPATNAGDERRSVALTVEEPAYLSYSDAQRYTGLGRTKLWELLSNGSIDGAKVGRAVRISRRSLDEYMKRNSYIQAAR